MFRSIFGVESRPDVLTEQQAAAIERRAGRRARRIVITSNGQVENARVTALGMGFESGVRPGPALVLEGKLPQSVIPDSIRTITLRRG